MNKNHKCERNFFVNLHTAYDLAYIVVDESEYTFDKGGRLLWVMKGEKRIERSLSNKFVMKWELGPDYVYRKNRVLNQSEVSKFYNSIISDISKILNTMKSNPHCKKQCHIFHHEVEVSKFLERILEWDYTKLVSENTRYHAAYSPIEIFPTDIPLPFVIQLTEGCAYNQCTFCGFYKGRPFKRKSPDEVRAHIREIKQFLGRSILNKKNVFLADANALMIEQQELIEIFDIINEELIFKSSFINESHFFNRDRSDETPILEEIYSFIDAFYGPKKTTNDFIELKKRHLKRVYVGLESGSDNLLNLVKKCNTADDIVKLTSTLKAAGLEVGIMIMSGLGGDRHYKEHVNETIKIVNKLGLDGRDSIHLSHLVLYSNASYGDDIKREGIRQLTIQEEDRQIEEIVRGFDFKGGPVPTIKGYEVKNVRF